jgi:Zn-finger nucleic acid-binding protein
MCARQKKKKVRAAERLCPKCLDKLRERPLKQSGILVDSCPTCHGLWFDRWELDGHLGGPEIRPPGGAAITDRNCPTCKYAMTSFTVAGANVTVDLCEDCKGIWLDAGELKQLEDATRPQKGILGSIISALGL